MRSSAAPSYADTEPAISRTGSGRLVAVTTISPSFVAACGASPCASAVPANGARIPPRQVVTSLRLRMFFPPVTSTPDRKMTDQSVFVNHCPGRAPELRSGMPKITPSAAASRRANILDAARHCFAVHGIHVSVDEICHKAGISKGAFYVYFDSKEAAIQALAEDHSRIVHEFAEVDSLDKLVRKVAELTTSRSTASKRLELETWTHALKVPALRSALWRNIDEM